VPAPTFLVFELGIYILAISCLRHAWTGGWPRVVGLVVGMLYGLLLEYAAIQTFHAYQYGHFLLMIGGTVPLCIGVGWGLIIYTAMETSDRFGLPWYLRPIVDAVLALTIDLSMDAIAIRLGFWTWSVAGPWFGVPLGNFYAWFIVVFGFSLLLRLCQQCALAGRRAVLGDIAVVSVALPLSILGLIPMLQPYSALVSQGGAAWLLLGVLLGGSALFSVMAALRTRHDHPLDLAMVSVPLCFHSFFFGALYWAGIGRQIPALIGVATLVLLGGLLLHIGPSWARLVGWRAPRARFGMADGGCIAKHQKAQHGE
jgi:Carotenoid biosynthesis protein